MAIEPRYLTTALYALAMPALVSGNSSFPEAAGLEVWHSPGCLHTEIFVREGSESMLTVYSITGQIKLKRRITTSGYHDFRINLKKGVYVASLVSGKCWSAKRITID